VKSFLDPLLRSGAPALVATDDRNNRDTLRTAGI
jgi:hypothetical protein